MLRSIDALADDLATSGMRGYARRLRRYRTEISKLRKIPREKSGSRTIISDSELGEALQIARMR